MKERTLHSKLRLRLILLYLLTLFLIIGTAGCLAKQIQPVFDPPIVPADAIPLGDTTRQETDTSKK